MKKPLLTVVMPVFNGERYIERAIESVLIQTFKNFELLIINDGSTDGTNDIINSFKDDRIRFIDLPENKGVANCRNLGLEEAKGEFLAWTDCDDINVSTRFEKQINFLQDNLGFGGCGTWLSRFKGEDIYYITQAYENPKKIKAALLFNPSTIPNATVMLRMSKIREYNLRYNAKLPISEDYDFIFRCSQHLKFTNLQEVLYKYRDSETSITKQFDEEEINNYNIYKIIYREALGTLSIPPTESNLKIHFNTCSRLIFERFSEYVECYNWLLKIELDNRKEKLYSNKALNKVLAHQFLFITKKASKFGFHTLFFFFKQGLKNNWSVSGKDFLKVALRCALRYDKYEFKLKRVSLFP